MKKLEKLSNEVFATLEKSEMNQVLGGAANGNPKSGDSVTSGAGPTADTMDWYEDSKGNLKCTIWSYN